jgi:hypothetical protein
VHGSSNTDLQPEEAETHASAKSRTPYPKTVA